MNQQTNTCFDFTSIGADTWKIVVRYFEPNDLGSFCNTCSFFRETIMKNNKTLWYNLCRNLCGRSIDAIDPKYSTNQWCHLYLQLRQFIIKNNYLKSSTNFDNYNKDNDICKQILFENQRIKHNWIYYEFDILLQACKADCSMIIDMLVNSSINNIIINKKHFHSLCKSKNKNTNNFEWYYNSKYNKTRRLVSWTMTIEDNRVDISSNMIAGDTPLNIALKYKNINVLKYLIKYHPYLHHDPTAAEGITTLTKAIKQKLKPNVIKLLLNHYTHKSEELIYDPHVWSEEVIPRRMINHSCITTSLYVACNDIYHDHDESNSSDTNDNINNHNHNHNHNSVDNGGNYRRRYIDIGTKYQDLENGKCKGWYREDKTALHFVCESEYYDVDLVKLMINQHFADPFMTDRNGNNALHFAAKCHQKGEEKVRFLIEKYFQEIYDVPMKNYAEKTPFDIALECGNSSVVKYLMHRSNWKAKNKVYMCTSFCFFCVQFFVYALHFTCQHVFLGAIGSLPKHVQYFLHPF